MSELGTRTTQGAYSASGGIGVLLRQHTDIRDLFIQVKGAGGADKQHLFDRLCRTLEAHETGEQTALRPVSRRTAGADVTFARTSEEAEAAETMAELRKLDVADPQFDEAFGRFESAVLEHAEREEREEFPSVAAQLSEDELAELGERLLRAEGIGSQRQEL
jgi:Hemerythrin HHE cation binding domain